MLIKVNTSTHEADGILNNMPLEAMIRDYLSARISLPEVITVEMDYEPEESQPCIRYEDLDEIFNDHLGQSYNQSLTDNSGCYINIRGRTWLSPQKVTEIIQAVLDNVSVTIEGEPVEEDDE